MSKFRDPSGAKNESRAQPDLRQQYRPIGIGAVAAALAVTASGQDNRKQTGGDGTQPPAENKVDSRTEPMAA